MSKETTLSNLAIKSVKYRLFDRVTAIHIQEEANQSGVSFYERALEEEDISYEKLNQLAASEYSISLISIDHAHIERETLALLPAEMVETYQILPLFRRGNCLFIAVGKPNDKAAVDQARFHTGMRISPILTHAQHLKSRILRELDESKQAGGTALEQVVDDINLDDVSVDEEEGPNDATSIDSKNPIVQFVNKVIHDAVQLGASDIHIEPYEKMARIRFRVDGIMTIKGEPPLKLVRNIVSRIKVLARLDIAERRLPQDGRIKVRFTEETTVDLRVSTLPTVFGEKVVIRVLNQDGLLSLDQIGMTESQLALYKQATHQPHGMILVTGPTGSGKTVSLYSALDTLNYPGVNISSAEDPVEIYAEGINQVSVNEKAGLTFAVALRTFLRQDPDILMVGEIRDLETAEIAVKSAQTGHLVLSTLHTNDAAATMVRLLNMGVAPFNIASTVNLIIAQRLVRCLCDFCKTPADMSEAALLQVGYDKETIQAATIYEAKGCKHCVEGYRGRTGIFEVVPISKATSELIMVNANQAQINAQLRDEKINTIRQEGLIKVAEGITSLAEIERVTKE